MGFVGYFTLSSLTNMQNSIRSIEDHNIPSLLALKDMKSSVQSVAESTNEYVVISDQSTKTDELDEIMSGKMDYSEALETYRSLSILYFPTKIEFVDVIQEKTNILFSTSDMIIKSNKTMTDTDFQIIHTDLSRKENDALKAIQNALENEQNELRKVKEDLIKTQDGIWNMNLIMVITIISFTTTSGVFFSKYVIEKLDDLMLQVEKLKRS
ncbi:MAG: hypothetical protein EPO62_07525 [Candidatus Nitrosotenuis sp.]|nr:MAG: hypothetical protein EPO62_07525 [Candidatus Nitrosotenuis sp.]